MRKRFLTSLIISILSLTSSVTAFAAPEIMADGGMFDAEYYALNNPDVVQVFGTDKNVLYNHYLNYGKMEGRQGFQITSDMYTTHPVASQKTLELFASGGTKGVHYKADGNYRYYRLGGVDGNWGDLLLERTDFPDGLIDLDGNGIDDRDPINSLGFIDLNLNGIDDRNVTWWGQESDENKYQSDFQLRPLSTEFAFSVYNYICEHGVVCKMDSSVPRLCSACRAIEEAKLADYNRRHSGHVSDDRGYKIGDTVFGGSDLLTYQGNDCRIDVSGHVWTAYLDENNYMHWNTFY